MMVSHSDCEKPPSGFTCCFFKPHNIFWCWRCDTSLNKPCAFIGSALMRGGCCQLVLCGAMIMHYFAYYFVVKKCVQSIICVYNRSYLRFFFLAVVPCIWDISCRPMIWWCWAFQLSHFNALYILDMCILLFMWCTVSARTSRIFTFFIGSNDLFCFQCKMP